MMISKTSKNLQNENEMIDFSIIKKLLKILLILLIIFTILYFTCFGCFLVLNDSTSWKVTTVTLSSEGATNETYPDSMGEYQLAEGEERMVWGVGGSLIVCSWYRHKDRDDRFIMYNSLGKNKVPFKNTFFYFDLIHN